MSNQYKAVKTGALKVKGKSIFKSDRPSKRKADKVSVKDDPDIAEHGGYWVIKNEVDFRGGIEVAIEAGDYSRCYLSAMDNGKFTLGASHFNEPQPHPEEILSLLKTPDDTKFSLKTGFGRYVGVDLDGRLIATAEAIGQRERFEAVFQDGKCAIQSASSNLFLTWLPDKESGSIFVSSKTAGPNQFINIRTNASTYVAPDLTPDVDKKESGECETSYMKMYQHSRVDTHNRMISYNINDKSSIKRAKTEGTLHETLLERRVKKKSDRYC